MSANLSPPRQCSPFEAEALREFAAVKRPATSPKALLEAFTAQYPKVEFFRFYWEDLTGITRVRIVTRSQVSQLVSSDTFIGVGASVLSMLQTSALNGSEEFGHVGQFDIVPHLSTLRLCGWAEHHASSMCSFAQNREPIDISPRVVLNKVLEQAKRKGLTFQLGFEMEFKIINNSTDPQDAFTMVHTWSGSRALSGRPLAILEETVRALIRSGIDVQHFEAEGGPTQFEIATGPLPAMSAIDTLVHSRETVRCVCDAHQATATFHPKPRDGESGIGAHLHFSFDDLSLEESFIAGILKHLPAICSFTVPTVVSYDRLVDSGWAGGRWVAWGTQNRETPLRKISPGHWEFKCLDGTANMYLAVAAIIAAGRLGVEEGLMLHGKDCLGKIGCFLVP
jgi:glutamine synthetase